MTFDEYEQHFRILSFNNYKECLKDQNSNNCLSTHDLKTGYSSSTELLERQLFDGQLHISHQD